ncbi:MAG TPA: protein kinase, partial [Acidobacteriota bacterium]|nr:protein kinase [Acidobacteriota bacterium]
EEDDRLRLTDFGLAKLKESSGITSQGTTVGTVGYMSPEQVQGQPVDCRSDVFSLGVILYELLTGKRPFVAEHAAAALYAIVHETPPAPRDINHDIPLELSQLVERALAKDPRDRFSDGREVEAELRAIGRSLDVARLSSGRMPVMRYARGKRLAWAAAGSIAIIFGLAVVLIPLFQKPGGSGGEVQADVNMLAVMPFENLSDSQDPERFGDIITELLTTDLSGSDFVTVVSSQRLLDLFKQEGSETTRGADRTLALRVARRSGATRMLTGSLSSMHDRKIITSQIVDVASGEVIGSERVDGDDLFTMVDDLAVRVKRRIGLSESQVLAGDVPVAEATTDNPDAYREYLLGMEQYHAFNWENARAHFDRALGMDTTFALAYLRIGIACLEDGREELGMQYFARARQFIDRATGCDRMLLQAMAVDYGRNLDLETARRTLEKASLECPTHKELFMWLGNFAMNTHERDTAYYYLNRALELDPNYPFALLILAGRLMADRNFTEARPVVERYMAVRPNDVVPYAQLGNIFQEEHQNDSALYFYRRAVAVAPDHRLGYQALGQFFVVQGQLDSALYWFEKLLASDNVFSRLIGLRSYSAACRTQGHFVRAVEYLTEAERVADSAGLDNQRAAALTGLASMHFDTDRLDDALWYYTQARDLDSTGMGSVYGIARVYATMGQGDRALRIVDSLHDVWRGRLIDTTDAATSRTQIEGYAALSAGRYQDAINAFQECQRLAEDTTACRAQLAEAQLHNDQYELAIANFAAYQEEAETNWPSGTYLHSLYLLADAYVKSGRSAEAIVPLERLMLFWGETDWDVPWMRDARRLYGSLTAQ